MKKLIQILSGIVCLFSLIAFLYGSIKLARVEARPANPEVISDIPGVVIKQPTPISQETAQTIVGVSIITLIVSAGSLILTSKKSSSNS